MSANIFISFAGQDLKVANTLCKALEGRGFKCWISSRDILPGENFQVAIVRAIRGAKMMLLVFTGNSNNSEEMTKELALASQHRLIVVPLRIEDVTPNDAFAYEFATRQWIDFFADWEAAMDQLSLRIASAIATEPTAKAAELPPVPEPNPHLPEPEPHPEVLPPAPAAAAAAAPLAAAVVAELKAAPEPAAVEAKAPEPVKPPEPAKVEAKAPEPAKVEPAKVEPPKPALTPAAAAAAAVTAAGAVKPASAAPATAAPVTAKAPPQTPPKTPAAGAAATAAPAKKGGGPPIALFIGLGVLVLALIAAAVLLLPKFLGPKPGATNALTPPHAATNAVTPPQVIITPTNTAPPLEPAANAMIGNPLAGNPNASNAIASNAIGPTAPRAPRKPRPAGTTPHGSRSGESTEVPF